MKSDLLKILQDLNFTEYEAKTYLALLEKSPLSGYGIARLSGVPRSKIYEVLEGMVEHGEVLVSYSEPVQYAPLPPRELIALRRRKVEATLTAAEHGLEHYIANTTSRDLIWDITRREDILARVREVASRAQQRILLQLWQEDAHEVADVLLDATTRGVEVLIVAYGKLNYPFARVYQHDLAEEITREFGGRWMIISSDAREIVAGIISLGSESRAAWTSHPGLVVPITEQIKHDIYIMEMLAEHRTPLESSFGIGLKQLRKRFSLTPANATPTISSQPVHHHMRPEEE